MKIKTNSKKETNFIVNEISHITKNLPKRESGSKGELEASKYLKNVLESKCGAKKTKLEHFKVAPHAFYSWVRIFSISCILTTILAFIFPLVGIVVMAVSFLIIFLEFGLYVHFLDPLFKKKNGTNLTAIRPCKKEVKARIFFSGHIDAVWNYRINNKIGGNGFKFIIFSAVIGALYQLAICIAYIVMFGPIASYITMMNKYIFMAISCLIFIPFQITIFFWLDKKTIVDGASDNLTGCLLSTSMLKALEDNNINLDHVEVGVIITGCEEAGLRGASAWAKVHKDEYKDVNTYIVCIDNISDRDWFMVNYRDLNATVKTDKQLGDEYVSAGKEVGIEVKKGMIPPLGGSTDAAGFVKGGFKHTTSISGLTHKLGNIYHTTHDTVQNLNLDSIEDCYKVSIKFLQNFINKYEG